MAWLTQDDLLAIMDPERVTQCCDDDGDGEADAAALAAVLARAEARVTGALASAGYDVGSDPAQEVRDLGAQAARLLLHERRPAAFEQDAMNYWARQYEDALDALIDGARVLAGQEKSTGPVVSVSTGSVSGF